MRPKPSGENKTDSFTPADFKEWHKLELISKPNSLLELPQQELSAFQQNIELATDRRVSPFQKFIPNGLRGAVQLAPLIVPMHDYGGSAFAFGANMEVEFPNYTSMQVGLEMLSMDFEIKNEAQFNDFPLLDADDPNAILHELKPTFTYLQIPIQLRQKFFYQKSVQATLGLGIIASKPLRQRFVYEFIGDGREFKLQQDLRNGNFSINNLRFLMGAEYELGRLNIAAELMYQHAFSQNEAEYFALKYWGINMNTSYRF